MILPPEAADVFDGYAEEAATLAEAIDRRMRDINASVPDGARIIAAALLPLNNQVVEATRATIPEVDPYAFVAFIAKDLLAVMAQNRQGLERSEP